jgi:fluoride exporter
MRKILLIGAAGMLGTLARYAVAVWAARRFGEAFPAGTLLVNLAGCFLAGLFFQLTLARLPVGDVLRAAVLVGFLGGFTTFSAYGLQTFALLREGQAGWAALNVAASNVGGLLAAWLGYGAAKLL